MTIGYNKEGLNPKTVYMLLHKKDAKPLENLMGKKVSFSQWAMKDITDEETEEIKRLLFFTVTGDDEVYFTGSKSFIQAISEAFAALGDEIEMKIIKIKSRRTGRDYYSLEVE